VERVARRRFAHPEREHKQRRQRPDPTSDHGDRVEGRIVRPVHVLEDEHGRLRRADEIPDEQLLDLVRRGTGRERLLQGA
jgi:hypothetical protein